MLTELTIKRIEADIHWLRQAPALLSLPKKLDGKQLLDGLGKKCDSRCWQWDGKQLLDGLDLTLEAEDIQQLSDKFCHRRLGYYYENLIGFILIKSDKIKRLERNIQVIDNKITKGEFDFILELSNAEVVHLEVAIKFYLCQADGSQLEQFVGASHKDQFALKWQQMSHKQLNLKDTEAGCKTLDKMGLIPTKTALLIQGYLFFPFAEPIKNLHPLINPLHLRGWWMKELDLEVILEPDLAYHIFKKPFWLSTTPLQESQKLLTSAQIKAAFSPIEEPHLIARFKRDEAGLWQELDRGFILCNDW